MPESSAAEPVWMEASDAKGAKSPTIDPELYWWVIAIRNGDQRGLDYVIEQFGSWIYARAYRMLGNHPDAEEAWQDIFFRIWRKIHLWDPERGTFQSWLRQIATNAIIDTHRRRQRVREDLAHGREENGEEVFFQFEDRGPSPEELLAAEEVREIILSCLERMTKPRHRQAWAMRHLEGMSIAEIAEVLGKKENTVKVWIFRATQELRQILIRMGYDFETLWEGGYE